MDKAKVRVYSDSVLRLGKMCANKEAITRWERQVEEFKMSASYKELQGIDGEPIELGVEYSSRIFVLAESSENPVIFENETLNLKNSQTGSSSCQCSTTPIGQEKETMEFVFRIQKSQGIRQEILAGTLDVPRSWR